MSETPSEHPTVPAEFLVERQGSTFITYRGLIHLAHQQGLSDVSTHLIQAPAAENGMTAIVSAIVSVAKGSFAGLGDANPGNVGRQIAPHVLRMAETRAIARALRVATNAAFTALEELGEDAPASPPAPTAPAAAPPERILVEGKPYTRPQVWSAYQQRRDAAHKAGPAPSVVPILGLSPDAPLAALVGASQELKRLLARPAPAADGATPVPVAAPPPEPEEGAP